MPSKKASTNPPKKAKWIKKGWVIKKVKNQVVFLAAPSYSALKCPKCGFYPCYANAYGSYHCPRCNYTWTPAVIPTLCSVSADLHPPKTCPKATCQYYPCYWNATTGSYHCPRCGNNFQ